jgi:phage baseplate assembly protein W
MATVTNTSLLNGLGLPALKLAGGYFASKGPYDMAWSDLIIAIFTPIGGQPMNRRFGCGLKNMLFEPMTQTLSQLCTYAIQRAAQAHCPHVSVSSVIALTDPTHHRVQLDITFGLSSDRAYVGTRSVTILKSNIIQVLQVYGNG